MAELSDGELHIIEKALDTILGLMMESNKMWISFIAINELRMATIKKMKGPHYGL